MPEENAERKISFYDTDSDERIELYVVDETIIGGTKYLLVAEDETDDSDAYIFKEITEDEDSVTYEPVDNEDEYNAIVKVFAELLDDTDIVKE